MSMAVNYTVDASSSGETRSRSVPYICHGSRKARFPSALITTGQGTTVMYQLTTTMVPEVATPHVRGFIRNVYDFLRRNKP